MRYLIIFIIFGFIASITVRAYQKYGVKRNFGSKLYADLRILIHGTKNAYTTLRNNDVVLFQISNKQNGKDKMLGVYKADKSIFPLCNEYVGGSDFFVDGTEMAISAEALNKDGKLLRVISSDRRGDCYSVEEYIDDDVYIPIRGSKSNVLFSSPNQKSSDHDNGDSIAIQILKTEMELARLKLNLQIELEIKHESGKSILAGKEEPRKIQTDQAPIPSGPYSQAVLANGLLFVSGCIAVHPASSKVIDGNVKQQAELCLANMKAVITAAGSSVNQVCKTTILLNNISDFAVVNQIYSEFLSDNNVQVHPARSTFAVAALPLGALVEIECIVQN